MEIGYGIDIPTWLILISSIVIGLYLYLEKAFRYWKDQGVESQTKLEFFIGVIKSFRQTFNDSVIETYNNHGRIFGRCFPVPELWISDPELLKHVLVKDFPIFRNRLGKFSFGDPMVDKMLSFVNDEDWKRMRSLMSPTFTSSRMRKMAYLVNQCAESLAKRFREKAEEGKEFDCKNLMSAFTVDVIASTAFATKLNAQENQNQEFVKKVRMVSNRNVPILTLLAFAFAPRLVSILKLEFFPRNVILYFKDVVLNILKERKEKKQRGNDFLQLMIDAQEGVLENTAEDLKEVDSEINNYRVQPKNKTMTLDEIISQCILFIVAGHDNTASALIFLCYEMALNPDLQEKLLKEIDDVWEQHETVDFDIVSKMPFLDATINETMRIHNPAPIISRVATEDYELADTGITIKKDTAIMIPTDGMHQDPHWFPEPKKFKPERFLPENKGSIHPYTYMPFGEGPRNCIGMRFVIMVLKLCIVHIFRDVKLVATDETRKPLKFFSGIGLQVKKCVFKAEKRTRYN